MKKKTNYEVGHEIPIDEKVLKVVDMHAKRLHALKNAMIEMSQSLNDTKGKLFDAIHEKYPELKDYEFSVDHEMNVIRISNKRK